jgi:hypothetical protein
VALAIGTVPLKFTPPSKKDQVIVTALECTGVITYARGAKSCAASRAAPARSEMNAVSKKRRRMMGKKSNPECRTAYPSERYRFNCQNIQSARCVARGLSHTYCSEVAATSAWAGTPRFARLSEEPANEPFTRCTYYRHFNYVRSELLLSEKRR